MTAEELLHKVLAETAAELGCDPDNEVILSKIHALLSRLRALERVAATAQDASRLRLFISTYSGRALDQPRGLAILDALDAALKEAGL